MPVLCVLNLIPRVLQSMCNTDLRLNPVPRYFEILKDVQMYFEVGSRASAPLVL